MQARTHTGWDVIDDAPFDERSTTIGSNFMVGNGYLGYRGTRPDQRAGDFVGCVVSDTYDMADGVWRELCTVPNGLFVRFEVNGVGLAMDEASPAEVELTLQTGEFTHRSTYRTPDTSATMSVRRFASLSDLHLVMQQITVVADTSMSISVDAGIDTDVWSLNGDHLGPISTTSEPGLATARMRTGESGVDIAVASAWTGPTSADLAAGESITITTAMSVASSNDGLDTSPFEAVVVGAERAAAAGYRAELERSSAEWAAFWDTADVVIEGNDMAQAALRFSIWHNRIATPAHTDRLPIGARGLSCQAYQGSAFWDQEMFNLPAYLYTDPSIARNILVYRWRTLDGARRKAQRLGYEGAYYAWISGTSGDELCPDFFFDDVLTGRPIRNHFNVWQMHISPDIALAVGSYWDATGDDAFIRDHGAEIVFEVADFLCSFVKYVAHRERHEIIRLLGPDEWHENVDNDAYTNRVTQLALEIAVRIDEHLPTTHPHAERWRHVHETLYVPQPDAETKLIEQFDGFSALEDVRPDELRTRLLDPTEYWGWPNGVAVHTRVSKQPAVVQMFAVDPSWPLDVQLANYDRYEPLCAHGSSLSHSVHATVACRLADFGTSYLEQAEEYFMNTATLDLEATQHASVGGTFIGGMHTAANAGAYQTAVFGFGGLDVRDGVVRIAPALPASWTLLSYTVVTRGRRIDVTATPDRIEVVAADSNTSAVDVTGRDGTVRKVAPGTAVSWN